MQNSNNTSCQTCLGQLELPINLFESSYSELLDVLQRLLAFQVCTEGSDFFVCQQCQRKLRWITEFQNICLKSLESLRHDVKYIKTEQSGIDDGLSVSSLNWNVDSMRLRSHQGVEDSLTSTEKETKRVNRKRRRVERSASHETTLDKVEADLNSQCYNADEDQGKKKRRRENIENCTKKLKHRKLGIAVIQAIKEHDRLQTDLKNRQCVFCEYMSTTFAMMKTHIIKKHRRGSRIVALGLLDLNTHRDIINNWCENCNMKVDDLQAHRDQVGCHLWLCRFCVREQHTAKRLREHLKICPKGRNVAVNSDVSDLTDVTDLAKRKPAKSTTCKRRKNRIKRLPRSEVLQAIKEVNSYKLDMKNRQCLFCDFVGEKSGSLQTHMTYIHRNIAKESTWCKHCNVIVDDVQKHRESVQCHLWKCKFCSDWSVPEVHDLLKHLKTHGGIRPAKEKEPKRSNEVNSHLCALCGRTFKLRSQLKVHACDSAEKLFKCPDCGRCYRNAKILRGHRLDHGVFVCQICGKRSTSKSCHSTHMKIHEAGGPVQCTICDKTFVRPGRLKLHMKEHTGDFQCMICGKSFRIKWLLDNHITRVHNEERPFKCSYCGRDFTDKKTCVRHEYIHTGEKPFKCLICPYSARNIYHLTTHMKQHPEDAPQASKPHKCPLCHRSFSTNTVLVSHARLVHGKKMEVEKPVLPSF